MSEGLDPGMISPAISVVLPVYNGETFLAKAIESILNQTYRDFEFIIINDGSKDGSKAIIDSYADKDERIVVIHQENTGLVAALNLGIATAKAPLIARMDADDIALSERFAKQVEYLSNHPEIAVLGSFIRLIDEQDKPIRDIYYPVTAQEIAGKILQGSPFAHPAVMMRKEILEEGAYKALYTHCEDYELWLRLSEKYEMANLPEILLLYRQHPHKISVRHAEEQMLKTIVAQLASRHRRSGKPDIAIETISIDTLDLFDITEDEKQKILFRLYEHKLYACVFGQDDQPVLELLEQAKKKSGEKNYSYFLSMLLQKVAMHYLYRRKYSKFTLYILRALITSPRSFILTLLKLTGKILYRIKVKRIK